MMSLMQNFEVQMKVVQEKQVVDYCSKRQIFKQYQKACRYINLTYYDLVDLKLLEPKTEGIYQFRVTGKYRALAVKKDKVLYVFEISDHQ